MSVKELVLKDNPIEFRISDAPNGAIQIKAYFGLDIPRAHATIDRNQAHLLMLYLQERFVGNIVETASKPINNVYATQIWNEAIEAAAKVAESNSAANIRKLKK